MVGHGGWAAAWHTDNRAAAPGRLVGTRRPVALTGPFTLPEADARITLATSPRPCAGWADVEERER